MGIYERALESKIKGMNWKKKWLTLSASVCVPYFGHFSAI